MDEPRKYKTASGKTVKKVQAASVASAVASIVLYLLNRYVFRDNPLPDAIEVALTLVITGAISGASAWVAGYLARPSSGDTVVPDRGQPPPLESSIG